ncbi:hypothetical protein WJU23_15810 [Prosthecobacter sp. SYSU 5D2]|uniref:hypothetical protein n=1 Tax=Prosthecobacter sp. SYSU 5D2 TaxID=3134134 RepID=UPI0031FF0A64
MFSLPKRPGPYILALLLIVLGILTTWMLRVLTDPALQKAAQTKAGRTPPPPDPALQLIPARPTLADTTATDPVIVELHQEMTREDTSPERELEIIQDLLSQHNRALGPGTFGDNNDVTRALVGDTGDGIWLPRQSPRIRNGELLDRWGTPYWFHANGENSIEIRSAGPDKNLFTSDDVILNESPAGLGATPEQ